MTRLDLTLWALLAVFGMEICQGAVIEGKASAYKGQTIQLFTYADFITETLIEVDRAKIGEDGSFRLNSELDYTYLALVRIGDIHANLYLEPAASHEVLFPAYKTQRQDLFSKQRYVLMEEPNQKAESLNALINGFADEFDVFVDSLVTNIGLWQSKAAVLEFDKKTRERYQSYPQKYLRDYVEYQLALLKLGAKVSRKELFSDHLYRKEILHRNDAYAQFVTAFYDGHFARLYLHGHETSIMESLKNRDRVALMETLTNTEFLVEEPMSEFVSLLELYLSRYRNNMDQQLANRMIETLAASSKDEAHRKLAKNMLESLRYMKSGTPAPDFTLLTTEGDTLRLEDLEGEYVYLEFWAPWCVSCMNEMAVTKEYTEEFPVDIKFISIALESEEEKIGQTARYNKFNWTVAHDGIDKGLRERYEVKTLPYYFVIDPKGNLHKSPAPYPTAGMHQVLWEIDRELHPEKDENKLQSKKKPGG